MQEDEELQIRAKMAQLFIKTQPKPALEALVSAIFLENRHQEQQWFEPAGNEEW